MLIDLPKNQIKFGLIGSGKPLIIFSSLLIKNGFPKPIIITWDKSLHKRDQIILKDTKNYEDIFLYSEKEDIQLLEVENVNNLETIKFLKGKLVNIIFSIKSRWILKDYLINQFNGWVINIHQGDLPLERGSAIYQRIMNNFYTIGVTAHLVTPTIDGGNILYRKTKNANSKYPTIDMINSINMELSSQIFNDFIYDLINRNEIPEYQQDNDQSIFMPQFFTEINGAIDWNWSANEIESFVRAFGPPMPGAFTFYKGKRISILKVKIERSEKKYHPFFNGRIVTINNEGSIRVLTRKDYVIVDLVKYGKFRGSPNKIIRMNSNAFFSTPPDILEHARTEFRSSLKMPPPIEED